MINIDGKTINMQIGVALEKYGVAPIIIDNRTFVPIRFVAEELGADVWVCRIWNKENDNFDLNRKNRSKQRLPSQGDF